MLVLAQRHSWIWVVLAPDHRLIRCEGDPELAEVMREAGLEVVEGSPPSPGPPEGPAPDAVLINARGDAAVSAVARAAATVKRRCMVAVPVAGGNPSPPGHVSRPIRALQLVGSAFTAISAQIAAQRMARGMRRLDLDVSRVLTGERVRARYGLGRGGWLRRLRLPVGSIVVGTALERRSSVVEAATDRAGQALGRPLVPRSTDVYASGKLGVELADSQGARYYLWVAAPPACEEVDRRRTAVEAVLHSGAPPPVRDRIVEPVTAGHVGPANYVLEPKVSGGHPHLMTRRLWDECLEFLTELHRLPRQAPALALGESWPDLELATDFLARHVEPEERRTLERVHREIIERVGDLPVGGGHGDFWRENLIVQRGRLRAVLDWEWAGVDTLPLLDFMDLVGHPGLRRSRALQPGPTFTGVLWPLVRRGGDERIRLYCAETGIPRDVRTLEGLAMAHWLLRTARSGLNLVDRLRDRSWFGDNVVVPLTRMQEAIGRPQRASV